MGQWRFVCDDGWDLNAAKVVCRKHGMLTEGKATAPPRAVLLRCFIADTTVSTTVDLAPYPVVFWLDEINCTGSEESLFNCSHAEPGVHDCGPRERAGVACEPKYKLLN